MPLFYIVVMLWHFGARKYEESNGERIELQNIIVLDIPDIYERMNPTLQRIIIEQYEEAINEN